VPLVDPLKLVGRSALPDLYGTVIAYDWNDDAWIDELIRQGTWPIPVSERSFVGRARING